jgi:hypothetical protein
MLRERTTQQGVDVSAETPPHQPRWPTLLLNGAKKPERRRTVSLRLTTPLATPLFTLFFLFVPHHQKAREKIG